MYGIPKRNLEKVLNSDLLPIIITEINGVLSLQKTLGNQYNLLVLNILPDSVNSIIRGIRDRSKTTTEEQIEQRLQEESDFLNRAMDLVHFHVLNTRETNITVEHIKKDLLKLLKSLELL